MDYDVQIKASGFLNKLCDSFASEGNAAQKPPQMGCLVGMCGALGSDFEVIIWTDEQFSCATVFRRALSLTA